MYDFEPENTPGATLRRLLILLIAALVMAFGIATHADSVRLYDQVGIEGTSVTLGRVAELEGPAARAFAGLEIATINDDEDGCSVTLDMVESALDRAGANWGLVSLRGFSSCKVDRLTAHVLPEPDRGQAVAANVETPIGLGTTLTLKSLVEQRLAEHVGVMRDEVRVTFAERDEQKLDVPILGRRVEVEPTSQNALGRVFVVVRFYKGQAVADTVRVSANVERVLLAVVAVGPVQRGDVFTRSSVQVRECVIDDDAVVPVTDPALIVGQESIASLRAGEMVSVRAVRSPIMVKRGEQVDVRCIVGGLVVRTTGRATQDGAINDRIEIERESTGESFLAVVTGRHAVSVTTDTRAESEAATAMAAGNDQEVLQ